MSTPPDGKMQTMADVNAVPSRQSRPQNPIMRSHDEVQAMSWNHRLRIRMKHAFLHNNDDESRIKNQLSGRGRRKQYRLEGRTRKPGALQEKSRLRKILTCAVCSKRGRPELPIGANPNQTLAYYLHWMFRVNFFVLFVVMCIEFFALVILFAGFITIAGIINPDCVRVGGEKFGSAGAPFADAFSLSWTTFSTVGDGSTYTARGYENESPTNCFFVNYLCSLEALIGVLYSGFCGAILFGKVLRIQSHAQVTFSDPIVVRYGRGVVASDEESVELSCPVLEFRIVNRLFNEPGGEILDASLNVVANIDADDADQPLRNSCDISSLPGETKADLDGNSIDSSCDDEVSCMSSPSIDDVPTTGRTLPSIFGPGSLLQRKKHQMLDKDFSKRRVSKVIFSKMKIDHGSHPLFKRVWIARHTLDEFSPIVKPRVRRMIQKHGGNWPEKLNTHSGVRESLCFNQILVSLNGVSNVTASDVYAQKIYDFVDVNIGYQFVNILYREGSGSLGVAMDLINDVREQNGGGGEPLIFED